MIFDEVPRGKQSIAINSGGGKGQVSGSLTSCPRGSSLAALLVHSARYRLIDSFDGGAEASIKGEEVRSTELSLEA